MPRCTPAPGGGGGVTGYPPAPTRLQSPCARGTAQCLSAVAAPMPRLQGKGVLCPVDPSGRYTNEVPDFQGMYIKDADPKICEAIKAMGRMVNKGALVHSYPFCWRCVVL